MSPVDIALLLSKALRRPLPSKSGGFRSHAVFARIAAAALPAAVLAALLWPSSRLYAAGDDTRPPVVSGRFYPAAPSKLEAAVQRFLADAVPPAAERPVALLAPHAGYIFSGQIMADAFAQARGHAYDLVVLLGVNHTTPGFDGVSIYAAGGFRTPLGTAAIDSEAARRLTELFPGAVADKGVHREEHSIEVLVPFVQVLFPGTPVLPVIVGPADDGTCERFGEALAQSLAGRKCLIVASSDLSHYPKYDDALRVDPDTLQAAASLDIRRFQQAVRSRKSSETAGLSTFACGAQPVIAAMAAAKHLGAGRGAVVSYANSGDALVGDRDRVVGYGAVAFFPSGATNAGGSVDRASAVAEPQPLAPPQQRQLLAFARKTLAWYFETETLPLPRPADPQLNARRGAFVTLKRLGELRGCIGHMADDLPLCQVVGRMALQAAFNDQRFAPLKGEELKGVEIEISVLTPFRPVDGPGDIVVGRDGVVLRKSGRSAVFLPQVATEQGWNRDEMLSRLCRKAGLEETAWRQGASFFTFQAQVFSEGASPP